MANRTFDLESIQLNQRRFVAEREWDRYHTPKNLAMALSGEVGELVEIFQWLSQEESANILANPKSDREVKHEIADVFLYLIRLCDVLGIDLEAAVKEKQRLNEERYPVHRARGSAKKYTEFE